MEHVYNRQFLYWYTYFCIVFHFQQNRSCKHIFRKDRRHWHRSYHRFCLHGKKDGINRFGKGKKRTNNQMFQNRQRLTDRQTETERQAETNGQTERQAETNGQTELTDRQFFPVKPSLQIQRYPSRGTST